MGEESKISQNLPTDRFKKLRTWGGRRGSRYLKSEKNADVFYGRSLAKVCTELLKTRLLHLIRKMMDGY